MVQNTVHDLFRKLSRSRKTLTHLQRQALRPLRKVLAPINRQEFAGTFRRLGLARGALVCVHASLSRFGYVEGGAGAVIEALEETVGPEGCIMMPSFPTAGSMANYIEQGEPFDVRHSPSRVGLVTEVFRTRPGVLRSLHPTNAVTAWGRGAAALLQGHEESRTPYGCNTPYGRLAEQDNAFILMLETHVHSFLHHLQERVNFPTLFLPEEREACVIDQTGQRHTVRTQLMRPRVPYFVAVPSTRGSEPDWALLHDFALMFPHRREKEVRRLGYRFAGHPALYRRRDELERTGALRTAWVGPGEVGLLHVKGFLALVEPEFRTLIERFRPFYDPERIAAMRLPYS
jgi:aminoglycoside 3-N-acetyltransferase